MRSVVEGHFGDPDEAAIDDELATTDLFALPGLADCHGHLAMNALGDLSGLDDASVVANTSANAWAQVEGGVLLVCDKGSNSDASLLILDAPPTDRPHLQMAGRTIATPGGYYDGYAVEVDDAGLADAVAAAAGPHGWVKIVADWPRRGSGPQANFSTEALEAAVAVAHAAGCRVAAHTMAPAGTRPVLDSGVDSVEHGLFMNEDDVKLLAERGGAWVPTLLGVETIVEFLGAESSGGRLLRTGIDNVGELLPIAEQLGVTILAGTDLAVPHGRVAAEAVRLAEAGLSSEVAIAAASTAAYDYLGVDRSFAVGESADAVFFTEDPRENPSVLLDPAVVMRAGRIVR